MRTLDDFANQDGSTIFKEATRLPQFFESNLLDPARVVKIFENDPQANIRVFYYQYLKLCFQLESVDYEGFINKIQQILNNEGFKFVFFEDDDPSVFSDTQFKNLIMQFFGVLGQGNVSIQQALSRYPIMDTVMIYFFRSILILTGRTDALDSYIDRQELLEYLCNYFGVEITFHDKCIKFVDTDIFVYEDDPKEVFMAYMDYDNESNPNQLQGQTNPEPTYQVTTPIYGNPIADVKIPAEPNIDYFNAPISNSSRKGINQVNGSYIASDFIDFTHNNANLSSLVGTNKLKQSGSIEGSKNNIRSRRQSQEIQLNHDKINKESIHSYSGDTYTYSQTNNLSYLSGNQQKSTIKTTDLGIYSSQKPKQISNGYHQWEPTKDPGFNHFDAYSSTPLSNKPSSTPSVQSYKVPSPSPQIPAPKQFSYSSQKPPSQPTSNYNPPYHPSPLGNDGFKKNTQKPTSYTSSVSESYKQVQIPKPISTYVHSVVPMMTSTGKSVYGLNVSLQFTNSFTMKAMCEPYKTNVYNTRERARNYRDSLKNFLR